MGGRQHSDIRERAGDTREHARQAGEARERGTGLSESYRLSNSFIGRQRFRLVSGQLEPELSRQARRGVTRRSVTA